MFAAKAFSGGFKRDLIGAATTHLRVHISRHQCAMSSTSAVLESTPHPQHNILIPGSDSSSIVKSERGTAATAKRYDDWTCYSCGAYNFSYRKICFSCEYTRSSIGSSGKANSHAKALTIREPSSPGIASKVRGFDFLNRDDGSRPKRVLDDGSPLLKDVYEECVRSNDFTAGVAVALDRLKGRRLKAGLVTTILRVLTKGGEHERALQVFESIGKAPSMRFRKDVVHYNAMLVGLAASDAPTKVDKAMEVFNEMRANQLAPNRYVYTTLLTLLIREKRPFEAIKLFEDVTEQGLRPDIPLYNSLMAAYNAVGMYAKAAELFKEIQQFPRFRYNPATYGTALATTSKSGNSTAALEVMAALKSQRRVQMNTIHYTQIITACYRDGKWRQGIEVYNDMLESTEVVPDRGVQLALLNCYALGKMRDEAYELFTTLKRQGAKSATSYGLVLEALDDTDAIKAMSPSDQRKHVKKMVAIYKEGVDEGLLTQLHLSRGHADLRAHHKYAAVRKAALIQLFRSLHSAIIDKDVLLIVGNNDEARDACLSTIRNLILPRGCLKTRVVHDGHAIAILKESIDAWVQRRKAELEQQEVFSIVNQDNR